MKLFVMSVGGVLHASAVENSGHQRDANMPDNFSVIECKTPHTTQSNIER